MIPIPTDGTTREMAPPVDWDEERDGHCMTLPIEDLQIGDAQYQVSTWMLTGDELDDAIRARAEGRNVCLRIGIRGTRKDSHPVLMVWMA